MPHENAALDDLSLTAGMEKPRDGNIALFLALYLLVLAFFILLVSISTVETQKSKAVLQSVTSTFASVIPPSDTLATLSSNEGNVIAAQQFQEQITQIVAATFSVAKTEIVQPGASMRVTLPADRMFFTDEVRFRDASLPLLDRVIASLSGRPDGLRYDVEFVVGTRYVSDAGLPVGESLEIRRAGAFAREMMARGAPPDSVTIGLRPFDPADVVIWFFVRDREGTRLRFDEAPPLDAAGEENPGG